MTQSIYIGLAIWMSLYKMDDDTNDENHLLSLERRSPN